MFEIISLLLYCTRSGESRDSYGCAFFITSVYWCRAHLFAFCPMKVSVYGQDPDYGMSDPIPHFEEWQLAALSSQ
jgi:hypothetical protein